MSSETQSTLFVVDGHPDETQLLLALERELSPEEISQVEKHLGSCWSCRARSEEMRRGILAFVEYREKRYLPLLPTPAGEFSGFQGRLRSTIAAATRPGLLARIWRGFLALFALPAQVKWVSVVAAGMVLVLFWAEVLNPPVVSASELLTRAIAAQDGPTSSKEDQPLRVAHQKVQIRSGGRTVVRDFQWKVGRGAAEPHWEIRVNPLEWNAPLTASAFAEWRDSLTAKQEKVRRSRGLLTLDTVTDHDLIKEAWMVVRANDFHPVEQHLRFSNDQELDLTELAFGISNQPQAPSRAEPHARSPEPVHPPRKASVPTASELDESELQLRYILFTHQWDLGEDLKIARTGAGLTLSGVVSAPDRERAMRDTLSALPNVQLFLSAPKAFKSAAGRPALPSNTAGPANSAEPIWGEGLEKAFPIREARLAFVDRCISESDTALSHAWALKRLAERYNNFDAAQLNVESRRKLLQMLRAHLMEVRRANANLDALLQLLPSGNTTAPPTPVSWSEGILSLFSEIQGQDRDVASLLAGTPNGSQNLPAVSENLRSAHRSISFLLDRCDQFLTGLGR